MALAALFGPLPSEAGTTPKVSKTFTCKPRPYSGIHCMLDSSLGFRPPVRGYTEPELHAVVCAMYRASLYARALWFAFSLYAQALWFMPELYGLRFPELYEARVYGLRDASRWLVAPSLISLSAESTLTFTAVTILTRRTVEYEGFVGSKSRP